MMEPDWTTDIKAAGGLENTTLYRMVRENIGHTESEIVKAKMLVIGRVYSAAVTRGAGEKNPQVADDEGLYVRLANRIVCNRSQLDDKIEACREIDLIAQDNLHVATEAHGFLNGIIVEAIKEWRDPNPKEGKITKRNVHARDSFVSKYLHFHAPMAFFIYDSLAKATLQHLGYKGKRSTLPPNVQRNVFSTHCLRMLECAENHYTDMDWTPRLIDGHLLGYMDDPKPPEAVAKARTSREDQAKNKAPTL